MLRLRRCYIAIKLSINDDGEVVTLYMEGNPEPLVTVRYTRHFLPNMKLRKAAAAIVDFCYGNQGSWIGTETIHKSGAFIELVHSLSNALDEENTTLLELAVRDLRRTIELYDSGNSLTDFRVVRNELERFYNYLATL